MSRPASGVVVLRQEVLYVDREWVHLSDDKGYQVDVHDGALLELILRGYGDFELLLDQVVALAPQADADALRTGLLESLQDPRSILELRPPLKVVEPEVIVCDLNPGQHRVDVSALLRGLRRKHRVLLLSMSEGLRGPLEQNVSLERLKKIRYLSEWYQFAQWCRAIVRRHPEATLVLCGPQDVVVFGDLAPSLRTLLVLDENWPPRTGAHSLWGADWVPEDPVDALRALHYALRFGSPTSLHELRRESSTAFAALEGFALRHADTVALAMMDQARELEGLRDSDDVGVIASGRALPPRPRPTGAREHLVIVTSLEAGLQPLVPLCAMLASIPVNERPYERVTVRHAGGWGALEIGDGSIRLGTLEEGPPAGADIFAAIAVPGHLRSLEPAFQLQSEGVPIVYVASSRPHPLFDGCHPDAVLRPATSRSLLELMKRLAAPEDPLAHEILTCQRKQSRRQGLLKCIDGMVQQAAAAHVEPAPESGEASLEPRA